MYNNVNRTNQRRIRGTASRGQRLFKCAISIQTTSNNKSTNNSDMEEEEMTIFQVDEYAYVIPEDMKNGNYEQVRVKKYDEDEQSYMCIHENGIIDWYEQSELSSKRIVTRYNIDILNSKYRKQFPRKKKKCTPFIVACEVGNFSDVMSYIEYWKKEGKLNRTLNKTGRNSESKIVTGLTIAADNGHENIVKLLIENGANANQIENSEDRRTSLMLASRKEYINIVIYLLDVGDADPNQIDKYGKNALHYAAEFNYKNVDTVDLLLNHSSMSLDVLNQRACGYTPLNCAKKNQSALKDEIYELIDRKGGKSWRELEEPWEDEYME
tara:strand:- start:233 stop:1207 length:975 start_codon:yes stop_codon:yes gene_type:complete